MLSLIDADIVCHRIGYTTENDDLNIAKWRCDEMLEGILAETGATEFQLWLSGSLENNFRTKICPEYKANRLGKPKPRHHEAIKEHMVREWDAQITYDQEADDALGIEQVKQYDCPNPGYAGIKREGSTIDRITGESWNSIICSIDKDLLQIPGHHYNFVKKEKTLVTPDEGLNFFYQQLLIGDTSDNIPGCPGIGVVKAQKALIGIFDEQELFSRVEVLYNKALPGMDSIGRRERILQSGQLLKIRTYKDEIWQFPVSS